MEKEDKINYNKKRILNNAVIFTFIILISLYFDSCTLFVPKKDPNNILEWISVPAVGTKMIFEEIRENYGIIDLDTVKPWIEISYDTITRTVEKIEEDSSYIIISYKEGSYTWIDKMEGAVHQYREYPDSTIISTVYNPLILCPIDSGTYWDNSINQQIERLIVSPETTVTFLDDTFNVCIMKQIDSYGFGDSIYFSFRLCAEIFSKTTGYEGPDAYNRLFKLIKIENESK